MVCGDMCDHVWGHVRSCVRMCDVWGTCVMMCRDMCNGVWGHM